jgi:hypothetical protein
MQELLREERFDFVAADQKEFIVAFDEAMGRMGYDCGIWIGNGYCWGRYMLIYRRSRVKSENVYARIYLRENSIVLRFYFNKIDSHRAYIEKAPAHIKEVFTGDDAATCHHDRNDENGNCRFRKSYTIDGRLIEKCDGITFEFHQPNLEKLDDYLALFSEFYPPKKKVT